MDFDRLKLMVFNKLRRCLTLAVANKFKNAQF